MSKIITSQELLNLPYEQIEALTKGKIVRIVMNNGENKDVCVQKLFAVVNPPHLFVGF